MEIPLTPSNSDSSSMSANTRVTGSSQKAIWIFVSDIIIDAVKRISRHEPSFWNTEKAADEISPTANIRLKRRVPNASCYRRASLILADFPLLSRK